MYFSIMKKNLLMKNHCIKLYQQLIHFFPNEMQKRNWSMQLFDEKKCFSHFFNYFQFLSVILCLFLSQKKSKRQNENNYCCFQIQQEVCVAYIPCIQQICNTSKKNFFAVKFGICKTTTQKLIDVWYILQNYFDHHICTHICCR